MILKLPHSFSQQDRQLNDFGFRSFRDTADGDYIAARLAYRAGLPAQYLWACQQALEKYMKCILFIHRIPATNIRHSLAGALRLIESSGLEFEISQAAKMFIAHTDRYGQYRYLEVSYTVDWRTLYQLDQTVWELRRYCTLAPGPRAQKLVEGQRPPRVALQASFLDQVLKSKGKHPARPYLVWQNAFFGRRRRHVMVRGGFHATNAPLSLKPEMLDEVMRYALIPKPIARAYREHAKERAAALSSKTTRNGINTKR